MNKEQEQEFFNQVEKVLHAHEDTYELGAWEEFDYNRKRKKRKLPIYTWIAAAVILLIASFGLYHFSQNKIVQNIPTLVKKPQKQVTPTLEKNISNLNNSALAQLKPKQANTATGQKLEGSIVVRPFSSSSAQDSVIEAKTQFNEFVVVKNIIPKVASTIVEILAPTVGEKNAHNGLKSDPVYVGAYDSLVNRNSISQPLQKNISKLTYSVVVSPSISNDKINFGAGMELSFAINHKFSINSGLMYSSFNAKSDGKSLTNNSVSPSQSANLALTGIELPFGIQYQTKGGFYAIAGVSAVGLIKDDLEYSFLEEKTVTLTEVNAGITTEVFKVVSEIKTEKSIAPINNYMGFFNFSAGKKQAFGKMNLNIGPFVKVPFSSVSVERIKLVQSGIRLTVDF